MSEVLSQNEIDNLLTAISSGDSDDDDFCPVSGTRRIRVCDFKHNFKTTFHELEPLSSITNLICNYAQRIYNKHLKFQVSGIWQDYSEFFYENKKDICFIDQRTWQKDFTEISVNKQFYKNFFDSEPSEHYDSNEAETFKTIFSDKFYETIHEILISDSVNDTCFSFNEYKIERDVKFLDTYRLNMLDVFEKNTKNNNSDKFDDSSDKNVASIIIAIKTLFDGIPEDESYIYIRFSEASIKNYLQLMNGNTDVNDKQVNIRNLPVSIECRLGETKKTISEIKSMGEGTIIELDKLKGEPSDIYANGVLIARGYIEVIEENFAVRIEEIL